MEQGSRGFFELSWGLNMEGWVEKRWDEGQVGGVRAGRQIEAAKRIWMR